MPMCKKCKNEVGMTYVEQTFVHDIAKNKISSFSKQTPVLVKAEEGNYVKWLTPEELAGFGFQNLETVKDICVKCHDQKLKQLKLENHAH